MIKWLKSKKAIPYYFIAPWIFGFIVFFAFPLCMSLYMSFFEWGTAGKEQFVGFGNYITMFTQDDVFWHSFFITIKFAIILVPLNICLALGLALLLNNNVKYSTFFKTAFYIPSIVSGVALAIIWGWILADQGVLNYILSFFGVEPVQWLKNQDTALFAVILTAVWSQGTLMLVFLSGLKSIPQTYYEAAEIDGAGPIKKFFKITLPLLSPTILFNTIMAIISAFQQLTIVMNLTGGGPDKSTYMYSLMVYENAFVRFKFGYAAANAWFMFVIILALTGLVFLISKKYTHYEIV